MTPERWQQIREVFGAAIERAPGQRAAFVKEVSAGDEDLRREVESLLASYERDGSFLEQPAFRVADEIEAVDRDVLSAGQTIGHYEVISLIGEGGMGEVYLARDEKLGRRVALKLLPARFTTDRERLRRFEREAQAASKLSHPNVCTIHEVSETDEGRHYIVIEYVEGVTLRERIAGGRRLNVNEVLDIGVQIVTALAAAHEAGIIHRDIKPENVIIRRDGLVKVLDFGLAKLTEHQQGVDLEAATRAQVTTRTGLVMGTPSYMSPEQARGLPVDARTDIWSLGCVLYEMVTGRVPFEGETTSHVIISVLERDPPPLAQFTGEVPAELEWIVKKALRKDREERYQTVREVLSDVKSLKHRLEFEAEAERSVQPDAGNMSAAPKSGTQPGGSNSHQLTAQADGKRLSGGVVDFQNGIKAHKTGAILALAALIIATAGFAYAAYLIYRRPQNNQQSQAGRQAAQRPLSRLTFDAGLQSGATWSPDGRFIAYSSDRGGNFDIWVQPVGGGDAVQVTRSPAQEWQPDWSPDGNRIVFRSEREGGGLFVVPALGGRERRVSAFGYRPRWSPDGTKILFLSSAMMSLFNVAKVYVTTPDGDSPRQILTEFLAGFYHLDSVGWHPDGRRVSVWGRQFGEWKPSTWDAPLSFWTIPLTGSTPIKSELPPDVEKQLKDAAVTFSDFRWAPSGEALYFEGITVEVRNLWKVMVDPQTLQWTAGPERLTTGVGSDTNMALSADGNRLAFTTHTESTRIWSLPFDARAGKVMGDGQPVTATGINVFDANLSRDGRKLTFTGQRPGTQRQEMWVKSLEDGREILLAADEFVRSVPLFSHDGERLVYNRVRFINPERTEKKALRCLMPAGGGEEQCLSSTGAFAEMPGTWSADGYWLIGSCLKSPLTGNRVFVCQFPVSASRGETEASVVAAHPEYNLWQPHFSPDERWICFVAHKIKEAPGVLTIHVVPASGGEWRRVTEEKYWADKPRWSPDGKTIYFLSNQGSAFFNVWGSRFDSVKGETVGEPFQVTSFGIPGRMISPRMSDVEIDLSRERLVLPITEVTGSIWMLDNVDR